MHYKAIQYFYARINNEYTPKTGLKPVFYDIDIGDGVRKVYD
jgi:hypothetical protein